MEFFTEEVILVISSIPKGKVTSYGTVARLAGNPRGARQVVRILHTQSRKHKLPWHRVINSKGYISLPEEQGGDRQRDLLRSEGVIVSDNMKINLKEFGWGFSEN